MIRSAVQRGFQISRSRYVIIGLTELTQLTVLMCIAVTGLRLKKGRAAIIT